MNVIPAIRKTGGYIHGEQSMTDEQLMSRAIMVAQRKIDLMNEQLKIMRPKADYFDDILSADGTAPITLIAKNYGMTAYQLNKLLYDKHIQYPCGGSWALYKEHADKGYAKEIPFKDKHYGNTHYALRWTNAGCHFIHNIVMSEKGEANG